MNKAHYFKIYELVDKKTYEDRGQKAWELISPELIYVIDELREYFGAAYINTWYWKKNGSQWRGLRTQRCKVGAYYSQHRLGNAADMTFKRETAAEVRKAIKEDPQWWEDIRCIERKVNWLHVDVRNCTSIKWVNP